MIPPGVSSSAKLTTGLPTRPGFDVPTLSITAVDLPSVILTSSATAQMLSQEGQNSEPKLWVCLYCSLITRLLRISFANASKQSTRMFSNCFTIPPACKHPHQPSPYSALELRSEAELCVQAVCIWGQQARASLVSPQRTTRNTRNFRSNDGFLQSDPRSVQIICGLALPPQVQC